MVKLWRLFQTCQLWHCWTVSNFLVPLTHNWPQVRFWSSVRFLFYKSPAVAGRSPVKLADKVSHRFTPSHFICALVSLIIEIAQPSAEYFKYLGNTEKYGDYGEGVHGTEEDGFLKVFRYHALCHIKSLFQSTGITHVQWVNLGKKERNVRHWSFHSYLNF